MLPEAATCSHILMMPQIFPEFCLLFFVLFSHFFQHEISYLIQKLRPYNMQSDRQYLFQLIHERNR